MFYKKKCDVRWICRRKPYYKC